MCLEDISRVLQISRASEPGGVKIFLTSSVGVERPSRLLNYRQGYHFVLISKICAYFQGQCLKKRECAYF